jgi:polysaccharide biosynthesis/export protein
MRLTMIKARRRAAPAILWLSVAGVSMAGEPAPPAPAAVSSLPPYQLQPGDLLDISVWKEPDLTKEVLVRPDGGLSFPLAGELDTVGMTVEAVRRTLTARLERFIPGPVVTVAVKAVGGRVYVLGKVNKAGEFPFSTPLDVMQAISLAGGTTPYAALNDIVILRRQNGGEQALPFHYSEVARGRDLAQNVQLQSGDTVVVP